MSKYLDELLQSIEGEENHDDPKTAMVLCWASARRQILASLPDRYRVMIEYENIALKEAREKGEIGIMSPLGKVICSLVVESWDGEGPNPDAVLSLSEDECARLASMTLEEYYRGIIKQQ